MKWFPFDRNNVYQKRPPAGKKVLLKFSPIGQAKGELIAVGSLKYIGRKNVPVFKCAGQRGTADPYEWCDCLPNKFIKRNPKEGKEK